MGLYNQLTLYTFTFFIIATSLSMVYPGDDGRCATFKMKKNCLLKASMLNIGTQQCQWVTTGAQLEGECSYQPPSMGARDLVMLNIVLQFLLIPAHLALNILFKTLLLAPIAAEVSSGNSFQRLAQAARRTNRNAVEGLITTDQAVTRSRRKMPLFRLVDCAPAYACSKRIDLAHKIENSSPINIALNSRIQINRARRTNDFSKESLKQQLLRRQSSITDPDALDHFETDWFLPMHSNDPTAWELNPSVEAQISRASEMFKVHSEHLKSLSPEMAGQQLLKLFFLDLFGAKTLEAKVLTMNWRSYGYGAKCVVSCGIQSLIAALLMCFNLVCIYFSIVCGNTNDVLWQRVWLVSCVVHFSAQVLVTNMIESIFIYLLFPLTIYEEVRQTQKVLFDLIDDFFNDLGKSTPDLSTGPSDEEKIFFSSPDYLFASSRLALANPDMLESALILHYKNTDVPRACVKCARSARRDRLASGARRSMKQKQGSGPRLTFGYAIMLLRMWAVLVLKRVGSMSLSGQMVIADIVAAMLLSVLALTVLSVKAHFAVVVPLSAVFLVVLGWIAFGCKRKTEIEVAPLPAAPAEERSEDETMDESGAVVCDSRDVGVAGSLLGGVCEDGIAGKEGPMAVQGFEAKESDLAHTSPPVDDGVVTNEGLLSTIGNDDHEVQFQSSTNLYDGEVDDGRSMTRWCHGGSSIGGNDGDDCSFSSSISSEGDSLSWALAPLDHFSLISHLDHSSSSFQGNLPPIHSLHTSGEGEWDYEDSSLLSGDSWGSWSTSDDLDLDESYSTATGYPHTTRPLDFPERHRAGDQAGSTVDPSPSHYSPSEEHLAPWPSWSSSLLYNRTSHPSSLYSSSSPAPHRANAPLQLVDRSTSDVKPSMPCIQPSSISPLGEEAEMLSRKLRATAHIHPLDFDPFSVLPPIVRAPPTLLRTSAQLAMTRSHLDPPSSKEEMVELGEAHHNFNKDRKW